MIAKIRNSYFTKILSIVLMVQMLLPAQALAITGGPTQPEFTTFTPVGVSDMVDLFSGDFQYNIPLLDVEGYPVNLSYSSGVGMEDEAGCVGLGWTLNAAGVINRSVRGIPDDFNGEDKITTTTNIKPNMTAGVSLIVPVEILGKELPVNANVGVSYNSYTGPGYDIGVSASPSLASGRVLSLAGEIGLGLSSENGLSTSIGLTASLKGMKNQENEAFGSSFSYGRSSNSRSGVRQRTIGVSAQSSFFHQQKINNLLGRLTSASVTIPVGLTTYIPQETQSMNAFAISGNLGLGGELFWTNLKGKIAGYINCQSLANPVNESPAYGYIYSAEGAENKYAMHDLNREKDGIYNKNIPAIAMTQMTYDIYSASGQGMSGMFRPFRDVGSVYDPYTYSSSSATSIGGDLGAGGWVKAGINFSQDFSKSSYGKWRDGAEVLDNLRFKKEKTGHPAYEQVYFKRAGEFTTINQTYYDAIHGTDPVRIQISEGKNGGVMNPLFELGNNFPGKSVSIGAKGNFTRSSREKRTQVFSYLTAAEADNLGGEKQLVIYKPYTGNTGEKISSVQPRVYGNRKGHHISEITVTQPDGARYVYGSQTYNTEQQEVTFNLNKNNSKNKKSGLSTYNPNDASTKNRNGIDHYYNCNRTPAYANAYQLTAILSTDYIDVDGDGPSPEDLGNYTKFNYTQQENLYSWRNPYDSKYVNFQEGLKFKTSDDKGTYLYGRKEIKYLHSIETKNYIAEFYYSGRDDAYDAKEKDITGGRGSNTLWKLDYIKLYNRQDRENRKENAHCIKTVHFKYGYTLCKKLPSSKNTGSNDDQSGKLTLEKVWFTYGNSQKGSFSPYQFFYEGANPDYETQTQDRWGSYKPNPASEPFNIDAPYSEQNKATADRNASAWHLTQIVLPSGGEINVQYEADDYAFVQNKRAASMVKILGFAKDKHATATSQLEPELYNLLNDYNYVYFDATGATPQNFERKYFGEGEDRIKELFYKCFVGLSGRGKDSEYVSGYVNIENAEIGLNGNLGWIELPKVSLEDSRNTKINPIAKTAMQFVRVSSPDLYHGGNNDNVANNLLESTLTGEAILRKLAGNIQDIAVGSKNMYMGMKSRNFGRHVECGKSYLRLLEPGGQKTGGGSRVKELSINDRWGRMRDGDRETDRDFSYGQVYSYTAEDPSGIGKDGVISSGVASYEPFVGSEENPFKQPKSYIDPYKRAPDNRFYQETPYGEMFFPSPSVGYSKVTVKNTKHNDVKRTAAGHTVNEFYTAKDFPVIVKDPYLGTGPLHKEQPKLSHILKINVRDVMTVSQSYAIELNDMHGKPKATKVYAENNDLISSIEYYYKKENSKQLSNWIQAIDASGRVTTRQAGIDVEVVLDERENYSYTQGGSLAGNLDVSPALWFPLPLPSIWPGYNSEETCFRSVSATKVITRYGILERTVAQDLGSHVTTDNLAWDAETGDVLLTKTQNNFEDNYYSFTYPAHWAYDGMGAAYKNISVKGEFDKIKSFLTAGDELLIDENQRAWVIEENGSKKYMDRAGGNITVANNSEVIILRSGRRNMPNTPVGNVTTRENPVRSGVVNFSKATAILNAGAVEFNAQWSENLCETCKTGEELSKNPYITGEKGNYRPKRSYVYLTGRSQSDENGNTYIREDGFFTSFSPFWKNPNIGNSSFNLWQANRK